MNTNIFIKTAIVPALSLLPEKMDTPAARAMVLAICLQESKLIYRQQMFRGPAKGFAQFEMTGIRGVLEHHSSQRHIQKVLRMLAYDFNPTTSYEAIQHNDVLCVCFARLLLWTLPRPLPEEHAPDEGWAQYIEAWRPGKPHPETWDGFYNSAWAEIKQ